MHTITDNITIHYIARGAVSLLLTLEHLGAHYAGREHVLAVRTLDAAIGTFRAIELAPGRWHLGEQTSGPPACDVVLSALRAWLGFAV